MKIERYEDETEEDWAERLGEEIAMANNTETTKYFVNRDPYDEAGVIVNYIEEDGWMWKEHPEGPFTATQIIEWKNKAESWDEIKPLIPKTIETLREVNEVLEVLGLRPSTQRTNES